MNLSILTLKTWLIILEIIQLLKYLLKKALNEIKNTKIIKYKRYTSAQTELLNLFNDLSDTILTNKTLKLESQEDKNAN